MALTAIFKNKFEKSGFFKMSVSDSYTLYNCDTCSIDPNKEIICDTGTSVIFPSGVHGTVIPSNLASKQCVYASIETIHSSSSTILVKLTNASMKRVVIYADTPIAVVRIGCCNGDI